MQQTLLKYLPERAVPDVLSLLEHNRVYLKIVNERVTKHGDYRKLSNGQHQITINASLNKYRFLMTLIHEIAHLVAIQKYGRTIKPHGKEWKFTFQQLMLPFINPSIYPNKLLPLLANHFKNPKASSDTDARLSVALKEYDPENEKHFVYRLPAGSVFRIYNGKVFKKGNKRIKRYECLELNTGKVYLFQPNAEVELLKGY
ncbi:SprT-like domain-containing protein [Pseudofulvibacter geojedonensis]|uniref:SprT-like domain-containing protein n=1 Tax=Pseudofulvibacter geojedonensis TaxID=1123758 RepID=A0ABW3I4J2_9FLAO